MPGPEASSPSVLIVDDSSAVRAALAKGLEAQGLDVLGGAADAYMARDLIFKLSPDVLTLDLQMPGMDGLSFLAKLMAYRPMPVVVLSSLALSHRELALQAMELGAVEVFPKPDGSHNTEALARLAQAIRRAAQARPLPLAPVPPASAPGGLDLDRVVAIGASTGGTTAIQALLQSLPASFPPVLIAQHMPPGFTAAFAERLNRLGRLRVREARHGDLCEPGLALIAPGGLHMRLHGAPGSWRVSCNPGPPVNHVIPSVDVLFHSVAHSAGPLGLAALLTGMGRDGAQGLLAMRHAGAQTLAQDEATSVIWGMPGEAKKLGAAESVLPLGMMGARMLSMLSRSRADKTDDALPNQKGVAQTA